MNKTKHILELIGNTPLLETPQLIPGSTNRFFAKIESANPSGSIKDRVALAMIEDAESRGLLNKDSVLVEPTSGNTGIGLSFVASMKGYESIIVMPESMSIERRHLIEAYGAHIILTPADQDVRGAVEKARTLVEEDANRVLLDQFSNPANPLVHMRITAVEIENCIGIPDVLVSGIGTGGTLTGIGRYFKEKNPNMKIIAIEPKSSIKGCEYHRIQGIGDGFKPDNLDESLIDDVVEINDEEAFSGMRKLVAREGILGGISSGAGVAALEKVDALFKNKKIIFFVTDRGERYLSMNIFG